MTETVLDKIISLKRRRIDEAKRRTDIARLTKAAFACRKDAESHRLASVLRPTNRINIIAEIKRASPSKGVINDSTDITSIANAYERGGACAVSVLTEEDHFRGSLDDLKSIRSVTDLPILQKDFFADEVQIFEAAAAGADAILLIVAALSAERIIALQKVANDLGLDVIVEVHDRDEVNIAVDVQAQIIGVNNRNLKTFEVSLDVSGELASHVPNGVLVVSESGISTAQQISELRQIGYSGFLIGESLMRDPEPESKLRELTSVDANISECSTTQ